MNEDSAGGGDFPEQLSLFIFKNKNFRSNGTFSVYRGVASIKSVGVVC